MFKSNRMTVKELAGFLNGVVCTGHGDAIAYICLDHREKNRDELLGIDSISILKIDEEISVTINSYMSDETIEEILGRFGCKGLIE